MGSTVDGIDKSHRQPAINAEKLRQVREMERNEEKMSKKLKYMKPAAGVSMVEYDYDGKPKDKTIKEPINIVIVPDTGKSEPEILIDEDKKYEELSEDEKEIRDCLNKEDDNKSVENGGYLEADFVIIANI